MLPIAVVTDEISRDLREALGYARAWGLSRFELREGGEARFPGFTDEEISLVEEVIAEGGVVTAVSPGVFKGATGDEAKLKRELGDTVPRAIELAQRFGCGRLIVFGFERYDGEPESGRTAAMRAFEQAAELASGAGMTVSVENEPNFWVDRAEDAAKLLAEIGHPALGLNWDPANQHWGGKIPTERDYEAVAPHLFGLHVKDYRAGRPRAPWFPLGEGATPWSELLPLTAHRGEQHPHLDGVTLETHCEPLVESSEKSLAELRRLLEDAEQAEVGS
jgi:sugar phosphate isomerase/epimerase